jgi:ATP-dependent DNA helicase RecQ
VRGEPRDWIVAALGHLEERGLVELKAADARQRFTLLARPDSFDELVARLAERFERRERAETGRIQRVLDLVAQDGCQVNALVAYFGEQRMQPCGHCTFCLTGVPQRLPPRDPEPALDAQLDPARLRQLRAAHPDALATPRQLARFLCGISSPAAARAKLTREPLFAAAAERRFAAVLRWCDALA